MKLSHILETTIDYRSWARGSKLIDADGMPLIYYHSSKAEFDKFDINKSSDSAIHGKGLYFTEHPDENWGGYKNGNHVPITRSYYLRAYNPLTIREYPGKAELTQLCKCVGVDPNRDTIPLIALDRKFGSLANAVKSCGFDALIHLGPANKKHILVYDNDQILPVV